MKEKTETTEKQKNSFDPYAPHKIKWWGWPLLLLLIAGTVYICRTEHTDKPATQEGKPWDSKETQRSEGSVFGTFYHITYQSGNNLQADIDTTLKQVDQSLSPFNKESVISAINTGRSMETNAMFVDVFTLAQEVSKETDGAFDITVAPLVNLWGFGFKNMDGVSQEKVDSLLPYVGYQTVRLKDGKVEKDHPETMLDCSAIAKGYGVDAVGLCLERQGVKNYMVEIGGEVRVRGYNPRGELWHVGINKPDDDPESLNGEIEQVLQITDLSMATSGNYRNYYEKDGKKYAHTIDPRTGYPVQHSILSSTVIATDCATADAYATSFMVMGMEQAKKVLAKHTELRAFFIYADKDGNTQTWHTSNLQGLMPKNER